VHHFFVFLSLVFPMSKIIQIIAEPNGSGKTTFAETYINNLKSNHLITTLLPPKKKNHEKFYVG
jgi:hypothetical protein